MLLRIAAIGHVRGAIRADRDRKGIGELRVDRAAVRKTIDTRPSKDRSGRRPVVGRPVLVPIAGEERDPAARGWRRR